MGETKIRRFLRPSHQVGSLISYRILPASGIIVSRTTVQCILYLETCTDAKKSKFKVFYDDIQGKFYKKYNEATFAGKISIKPTMEMWDELAEKDETFKKKFNKLFYSTDVKEADNGFTADLYDQYVNMELTLDQGGDRPEFARAKKN